MSFNGFKKKWLSKFAIGTCVVLTATCVFGLFGCGSSSSGEDDTEATSRPDTQLLKNGNFEYYTDNDGEYFMYFPDNWTRNSTGTSSYTSSGVINTAPDQWSKLTSLQSAVRLYLNNLLSTYNSDSDLSSSYSSTYDDLYVDYNGLEEYDLLFKDPATAISALDNLENFASDDEDNLLNAKDFSKYLDTENFENDELQSIVDEYLQKIYYVIDKDEEYVEGEEYEENSEIFINNPFTHDKIVSTDEDGNYFYTDNDGETHDLFLKDEDNEDYDYDSKLYTDEECEDALESSVLMIHNYLKNGNGTSQYYGSSTTITLEENTAAKISVWVKTSDLYQGGESNKRVGVEQDRGAYIEVTQTVGSTSLDSFKITSINTEKLNPKPEDGSEWENNGWVKYDIYVQACDYANTTISLNVGLGGTGAGSVEGYAFFDDIEVTKYRTVNAMEESITAELNNENEDEDAVTWSLKDVIKYDENTGNFLTKAESTEGNYVTLLSEGDEKVFEADVYSAYTDKAGGAGGQPAWVDRRYADEHNFYIDLTASSSRDAVALSDANLTMGITVDDNDYTFPGVFGEDGNLKINYTTSTGYGSGEATFLPAEYKTLYKDLFENEDLSSIDISKDLLANIVIDENFDSDALAEMLVDAEGFDYLDLLADELCSATLIPNYQEGTNTVVILSATGASYTADIDDELFELGEDEYLILSVWVKTSDTKSCTAATLTVMDVNDDTSNAYLTVNTTDVTTDIDDDEDIYDGWVQCFFYIHNETDETQQFKLRLQFGETNIAGSSIGLFSYGWAAFTNIQVLKVTEKEFDYTQTGSYAASYSFSQTDNRTNGYFDDATKDSLIKSNITGTSSYSGVNGASTSIQAKEGTMSNIDFADSNDFAGLVNIDYFEYYLKKMFGCGEDDDVEWGCIADAVESLVGSSYEDGIEDGYEWLTELILSANAYEYLSVTDALASAEDLWRAIFGSSSVQPLLIVNCIRTYTNEKETELTTSQIESGNYYVYVDEDETTGEKAHYLQVTEENYDSLLEAKETFYTLEQALNYGFLGSEVTLEEDTYTAITVKVKVVGDAVAYIYLTDTTKDRDILTFEVPEYTFWYDNDGNVLIAEPDEDDEESLKNIAYELRTDGLYEIYIDADRYKEFGVDDDAADYLYSNMNIYNIQYYNENVLYYDRDLGQFVSWDDLDTDVKYYAANYFDEYDENGEPNEDYEPDETKWCYAPHYLVSTSGIRVFEYAGSGTKLDDGKDETLYYYYYYDEDDDTYTVNKDHLVKTFDTNLATPRYYATDFEDSQYMFKITSDDCQGDWVTVSFLIHTGNESKSYRLELWSGERSSTGLNGLVTETDEDGKVVVYQNYTGDGNTGGYVVFDYSYVDLDESSFTGLMDYYSQSIIEKYQKLILKYCGADGLAEVDSYDENIAYYEKYIEEYIDQFAGAAGELEELKSLYKALYYTFTLYDSAAYVPFNDETAQDDETGYDYKIGDFDETLAYFLYKDESNDLYTIFIDYGTVNQEIEVSMSNGTSEEEESESSTNAWILASSIALVVILLATLISMMVREIIKRNRIRNSAKRMAKNQYTKKQRYIRQYAKANGDVGGPDDVIE